MDAIYKMITDIFNNQIFMAIFQLVLPTLVSTGIITALLSHWYDKKLHTHEIKIQKYINLIEQLAKFTANDPTWEKLRLLLNEALLFASDKVVAEIFEFNKKFTVQRKEATNSNFQMTAQDLQPLVIAIRKDLDLKSKSIKKNGLTFFQKP